MALRQRAGSGADLEALGTKVDEDAVREGGAKPKKAKARKKVADKLEIVMRSNVALRLEHDAAQKKMKDVANQLQAARKRIAELEKHHEELEKDTKAVEEENKALAKDIAAVQEQNEIYAESYSEELDRHRYKLVGQDAAIAYTLAAIKRALAASQGLAAADAPVQTPDRDDAAADDAADAEAADEDADLWARRGELKFQAAVTLSSPTLTSEDAKAAMDVLFRLHDLERERDRAAPGWPRALARALWDALKTGAARVLAVLVGALSGLRDLALAAFGRTKGDKCDDDDDKGDDDDNDDNDDKGDKGDHDVQNGHDNQDGHDNPDGHDDPDDQDEDEDEDGQGDTDYETATDASKEVETVTAALDVLAESASHCEGLSLVPAMDNASGETPSATEMSSQPNSHGAPKSILDVGAPEAEAMSGGKLAPADLDMVPGYSDGVQGAPVIGEQHKCAERTDFPGNNDTIGHASSQQNGWDVDQNERDLDNGDQSPTKALATSNADEDFPIVSPETLEELEDELHNDPLIDFGL